MDDSVREQGGGPILSIPNDGDRRTVKRSMQKTTMATAVSGAYKIKAIKFPKEVYRIKAVNSVPRPSPPPTKPVDP